MSHTTFGWPAPNGYPDVRAYWLNTGATLARWNAMPWPVLRAWLALSAAIAIALLAAVWAVASATTPDPTPLYLPGISGPADPENVLRVLFRNSLVLALHATACVAGFIAGASMPIAAAQRTGFSRWVHLKAGQVELLRHPVTRPLRLAGRCSHR